MSYIDVNLIIDEGSNHQKEYLTALVSHLVFSCTRLYHQRQDGPIVLSNT